MRLSLVIPAYNEERRIGDTLVKAEAYLATCGYGAEIVVVDDGSSDATAELIRCSFPGARLLSYGKNRGKGHAVKTGMLAARGDFRVFYDADGSTPIEELGKLWPHFEDGADIVIGSRSLPDSDVEIRQRFLREHMGRAFNHLLKCILHEPFVDTQCGFKGFTAAATETVFSRQRMEGFSFDSELLFIALLRGLRVDEVPVRWRNSPDSRVRIVGDSLRMFLDLFRIRWDGLLGRYR